MEQHRGIQRLRGFTSAVRAVAISPDGRWLAALSDEWKRAVWSVDSGSLAWRIEIPVDTDADSVGITFSKGGGRLGVASGNEVRSIDLATGELAGQWVISMGQGKQIWFLEDGRLRAASVESSAQRSPPRQRVVHELAGGATPVVVRRQQPSDRETMNVVASPDGPDQWSGMLMDPLGEWSAYRTRSDGPTVIASLRDGKSRIALFRGSRLGALAPSGE